VIFSADEGATRTKTWKRRSSKRTIWPRARPVLEEDREGDRRSGADARLDEAADGTARSQGAWKKALAD
jgi:hypothetical protein